MAFKEVRRRSSIFRPWSSGLQALSRPGQMSGTNQTTELTKVNDSKRSPWNMFGNDPNAISHHPDRKPHQSFHPNPELYQRLSNNHHHHHHLSSEPMLNLHAGSSSSGFGLSAAMASANSTACHLEATLGRWGSSRTKKQRPKRFQCPHCQVSFSNNGQLKGHIRIHTGERPFACDQPDCGKTFTRNEELTRHKRIHTGVRPFACPLCGKKFGRKDHLKKHVKTHQRPPVLSNSLSSCHFPMGNSAMLSYMTPTIPELIWAGLV